MIFPRKYPLGLGVVKINPLQMARAFATFPNQGRLIEPIAIRYVEDRNGRLVLDRRPDVILLRHALNRDAHKACGPDSSDLSYRHVADIWQAESFRRDYEAFIVEIGQEESYTLYRRKADLP